jgi:hypothetical protein
MRNLLLCLPALLLLAPEALAAPMLTATPSSIALAQTMITINVDPNGSDVSGLQVTLSALTTGLPILAIGSTDPVYFLSGPTANGPNTEAGFIGVFPSDRSTPFTVGTLTVSGITAGTPLMAQGTFTVFDASGLNDLLFGPITVATVVPEPGTAALIGLGFALLVALRRSSP